MPDAHPSDDVAAVRRFTRFYTQTFGVLGADLYDADLSLTEARIIYELGTRRSALAGELGRELGVDPGYMSRMVRGFSTRGLILRKPSPDDGRARLLTLSAKGKALFNRIDRESERQVGAILDPISQEARARLRRAMAVIERGLGGAAPAITLRAHRPGDMGFVVSAHADLYAREYGWDITFEAMVAEIVAKFIREFQPDRERCWIAEMDSEPVGSVFIVKASDEVAKLRLLIIHPHARGFGLGKRLVEECIRFSRDAGYKKITLWTNDILHAARAIYVKAGFTLVASEAHHSFGQDLVGETWERAL